MNGCTERGLPVAYVVGHLAHEFGGDVVENMLQVDYLVVSFRSQLLDTLEEILRQSNVGKHTEVSCVEKTQPGLPLSLPQVAIGIDDAIPKQEP